MVQAIPLFPLPSMVLFPSVMLPLHIFESRYREMVADLMDLPKDERFLVITCADEVGGYQPVGTLGQIIQHQPLEEGRSNILIQGIKVVDIQEATSRTAYRQVIITNQREEYWPDSADPDELSRQVMDALTNFADRLHAALEDLPMLSATDLVNSLAFSLDIKTSDKQELLEEQNMEQRALHLVKYINDLGYFTPFTPTTTKQTIN